MAQYALDDLTFNLVPDNIPMPDLIGGDNIDQTTAEDIYRQAHKMAYNVWPKTELGKSWQLAVANSIRAQMDFKTFCLYVIVGYMVTHEHTPFYVTNLTASSSIGKVEEYRKACLRKFGASDARSLGLMLNINLYDIDDEILASEVSFGRYVTGYIASGADDFCAAIYDKDEISFSPYWLAIEGTYYDNVFTEYLKKVNTTTLKDKHTLGNPAQLRHRHLVSQIRSVLKRRSHLLSTIFTSRSRIMPKAAKLVLDHHGLTPKSPICKEAVVYDAYEFWVEVGEACPRKTKCHRPI